MTDDYCHVFTTVFMLSQLSLLEFYQRICPNYRTIAVRANTLIEKLNASFSYTLDQNTCI